MERKIGEIFEYDDKKLKVVDTEDYSCRGCYFLDLGDKCYDQICMRSERKDRKNVVFTFVE